MPIKIPSTLPGRQELKDKRVPLILEERAMRQDIRPLQILILNLMPDKIRTEAQLLRVLGLTPLQLEITLIHPATHTSKNTSAEHLIAFYQTHDEIKDRYFDGMMMTGAPVEQMPFEEVNYWQELQKIMDWAQTHVYSSFFICWGAQAAMHHHYGVPKYDLPRKQFGVYPHRVIKPYEPLTSGFDDGCGVPVSRHTEIRHKDVEAIKDLDILLESEQAGICLVQDIGKRRIFMFNHLEYEADTLKREYDRDAAAGLNPEIPFNYFPGNDPSAKPYVTWRAHRTLLFTNWINLVYQGTPYDLKAIPKAPPGWEWG